MGKKAESRNDARSKGSLAEMAYVQIKEAIIHNRLPPGEPIVKEELIQTMGLTRTPLREALLRLRKEGLVEIRPQMGTFVSQINIHEIHDMYDIRGVLEGLAARSAAGRIPKEEISEIECELKGLQSSGLDNVKAMSGSGRKLHQMIIRHCGNIALVNSINSIQDHFTRFRMISLEVPEKVFASHKDHLRILSALKRQDPELAESRMRSHFERSRKALLSSLVNPENRQTDVLLTM